MGDAERLVLRLSCLIRELGTIRLGLLPHTLLLYANVLWDMFGNYIKKSYLCVTKMQNKNFD